MRLYTHTHTHTRELSERGITLIAIVITIIVLLIIAGISVTILTGNNGILNQTNKAKDKSIIGEEKEQIVLAYNAAKIKQHLNNENQIINLYDDFKSQLVNENKQNASVMSDDESIVVKYNETKHIYTIDRNESVLGPVEQVEDEYPGDITKNNTRTGNNEEEAYIINCIEDLVEFSARVNQGETFQNKYIKLNRNLDFKSISSYNDIFKKYSYDDEKLLYKEDSTSTTSIKELLNGKIGFIPIGKDDTNYFSGTFDGQENKIENLFINNEKIENVGFFGCSHGTIQRLGIVNSKIISKDTAGSICGKLQTSNGKVQYCYNINGDIEGVTVGGIVGKTCESNFSAGASVVKNCYNTGKIFATSNAGGIVGQSRILVIYYICI